MYTVPVARRGRPHFSRMYVAHAYILGAEGCVTGGGSQGGGLGQIKDPVIRVWECGAKPPKKYPQKPKNDRIRPKPTLKNPQKALVIPKKTPHNRLKRPVIPKRIQGYPHAGVRGATVARGPNLCTRALFFRQTFAVLFCRTPRAPRDGLGKLSARAVRTTLNPKP